MLSRLYKLDHLYGLLLTFGIALMIPGRVHQILRQRGTTVSAAEEFAGAFNLGFMLPAEVSRVGDPSSAIVCFGTWYVIERTKLGSYLRAATENPALVQAFGINVQRMVTLTYGFGVGWRVRRRDGGADLPGESADGRESHHRRLRGRGHRRYGLDLGAILTGFGLASSRA
jgi:hypothetical protein